MLSKSVIMLTQMGIRTKMFLLYFVVLSILILFTFVLTQFLIKNAIFHIEKNLILEDVNRLKKILASESLNLLGLTKDWSAWTDAWLFMQGKNPSFVKNNITMETFTNNKINLLVYYDLNGKIKSGAEYSEKSKKLLPVNEGYWEEYLKKFLSLDKKSDLKIYGITGISFKDNKPIIVAIAPVLKSDFTSPVAGYLLMVRYFTEENTKNIEYLLGLNNLKIEKIAKMDNPKEVPLIKQDLENYTVSYLEDDFFGIPIISFTFQKEKILWNIVKKNLGSLTIFYLSSFLIFGTIFLLFTKRQIVDRIEKLVKNLNDIKSGQKNEVNIKGKDEIGYLSEEINKYINAVKAQIDEKEKNRKVYEIIAENSGSLIFLFDSSGDLIYTNSKANEILMNSHQTTHPKHLFNLLNDIARANEWEKTYLSEFKLNENVYVNGFIIPLSKSNILFIAHDITHLKKEKEKLLEKASKDSLTSLYNRTYFENSINRIFKNIRQGEIYSLLFIDLDDLKLVNDKFGHIIGDEVIKETANSIKKSIRENDLAVRWGGDEFLVVIKGNTEVAKTIAERIQTNLGNIKFSFLPETIKPTVSIGITKIDPTKHIENTIKEADIAAYDAKKEGKNKIKIFPP